MSTRSLTAVVMVLIAVTGYTRSVAQETPNLGRPATPAEVAGWDISIPPDGTGLPPGSGRPEQGASAAAQLEQGVGIFSCFPAMYISQPLCVAPAVAYGPVRTRGEGSDGDGGWLLGAPYGFLAGGADADSFATLLEGRGRFRLERGGADIAALVSFLADVCRLSAAAAAARSLFSLRAPREPRFPDIWSHLATVSAGLILAMWA